MGHAHLPFGMSHVYHVTNVDRTNPLKLSRPVSEVLCETGPVTCHSTSAKQILLSNDLRLT